MSILQSMLADLAIESGVMEEQEGSPEELTIVTDDTVTELEDEISELADKVTDSNSELDQVLEASDAIVSTEALLADRMAFLRNPQHASQYNRTVQAMNWQGVQESMEGYKFPTALYEDVVGGVSFEAEEGADGSAQAAKDVEKKDGLIKKFLAMLAGAARAAKALFIRFLDLFRTSNEKNGRSVDILAKYVANREGVAKSDKVKTSGYRELVVGGAIDAPAALKMIKDGYNQHLKGAQAKIDGVVVKVADVIKRSNSSGVAGVWDSALKGLGFRNEDNVTAAAVINKFLEDFPKDFEYALGGGRKASFAVTRKSSGSPTVSFSISATSAEAPKEMATPSLNDVSGIVTALRSQHKFIEEVNKSLNDNIKISDSVLKAAEIDAKKPGVAKSEEAPLRAVVGAAQAVLNISKIFLPKYNQLALSTAHQAYKFGLSVASKYPKKGAAKAE